MRVVVDFDKCKSNALCMAAAPEVFEVRDDNFLYVLQEEPGEELRAKVEASYREQTDVRYAAARLWVDRILDPADTRQALLLALEVTLRYDEGRPFRTGVLQV